MTYIRIILNYKWKLHLICMINYFQNDYVIYNVYVFILFTDK